MHTTKILGTVIVLFALCGKLASTEIRSEKLARGQLTIADQTQTKWLVILSSERDYKSAKRGAQRISRSSAVAFSMDGMVFDQRRGLIVPDKGDGAPDAGRHLWRRYNETTDNPHGYISIEKSDDYPGLRSGLYIVVAAICDSRAEAESQLRRFRPNASSAYIARTGIYMRCMH